MQETTGVVQRICSNGVRVDYTLDFTGGALHSKPLSKNCSESNSPHYNSPHSLHPSQRAQREQAQLQSESGLGFPQSGVLPPTIGSGRGFLRVIGSPYEENSLVPLSRCFAETMHKACWCRATANTMRRVREYASHMLPEGGQHHTLICLVIVYFKPLSSAILDLLTDSSSEGSFQISFTENQSRFHYGT